MSFRFPYVSLDIETTGVDKQKSHVLQLAAVYDNGDSLKSLQTFTRIIKWKKINHGEEYAMNLNKTLLSKTRDEPGVTSVIQARQDFSNWLDRVQPKGKLTAAGKNVAGFDLPILQNNVNKFYLRRFLVRCLDPGSMYSTDFNHIPSLNEINTLLNRKAVSHDALEDAWDVVHAIRYKWL